MRRSAFAAIVAAIATLAPAAQSAPRALPAPSFTVSGTLTGLAASGARVALATDCDVRVARFAGGARTAPVRVRGGYCADSEFEGFVSDVWLGRSAVTEEVLNSPSPHGDAYSLWRGPLPAGPVRQVGDDWSWTDSSDEPAYGCAGVVAAGGGVIASTQVPNRLAVSRGLATTPVCPSDGTTVIAFAGATRARTSVSGSWTLLATDGRRLVLSRLDPLGRPTGALSLIDVDGTRRATPRVPPAIVKTAVGGWLAPEGLVLSTRTGLAGPGWKLRGVYVATVAYGRVVYVRGNTLRARRIRGGADRPVLGLPAGSKLVAAGSFGVAVAVQYGSDEPRTSVHRLPWRTIDAALPRR